MGYSLPKILWCPAHAVLHPSLLGDVVSASVAALGAQQLFESLVAERQHGIVIDHQPGLLAGYAQLLQFFGAQQMQKIFSPIALKP